MFKHVITRCRLRLMLERSAGRCTARMPSGTSSDSRPSCQFYPLLAYHWTRSGVTANKYLSLAGAGSPAPPTERPRTSRRCAASTNLPGPVAHDRTGCDEPAERQLAKPTWGSAGPATAAST
jgi:hypothetical protein